MMYIDSNSSKNIKMGGGGGGGGIFLVFKEFFLEEVCPPPPYNFCIYAPAYNGLDIFSLLRMIKANEVSISSHIWVGSTTFK